MIDHQTVERVLDAAAIIDVVQEYVHLKKRGVNYLGLCPFHNEKTPSFTVSPAKGIFKCFGCGKGGNSVNFIMEHEHLSYPEAIRYLAKKYISKLRNAN
jgi:DNA primase